MPRLHRRHRGRHMRRKQAVRVQGAQQGAIWHHPGDAGEDHDGEDRGGKAAILEPHLVVEPGPDRIELHADQYERQHVEHEHDGFPHRIGGHAQPRRGALRRGAGDRDRIGDDGENAGQPDMLGDDPHHERAGELRDDCARRLGDAARDLRPGPREQEAGNEASEQRQRNGRHELVHLHVLGGNQADRDAVDQQCAGIVEQAFALEDLLDAVRQVDLAQDRGGRRGVGRCHDGAERDRDRPWHVRAQPVRDHSDGGGRDPDRDQHQCRDRQPVVAKVAQRGIESGIQQHRRHEQRQRQIRLQRPRRTRRHEGQQHAADRKKCRIGHLEPPRQRGQQHRAKQQPDDPFEC